MRRLILLILGILCLVRASAADEQGQTIMLKDGSVIKGKLISFSNSTYTVQTPSAGILKISSGEVQNISSYNPSAETGPGEPQLSVDMINSFRSGMMQDPEIMALIQELIKDPQVAQIMKNPDLLKDALSMDQQKIQNNPDVQKLIQNPTMQKILKLTVQKMQLNETP